MPENTKNKITFVPIEKLHLDNKNNPRLPNKIIGATESIILEYMVTKTSLLELMESIGEKGFFPGEPLLVVPAEKKDEYAVIEGNRRLSAVRLLNDPTLVKAKQKPLSLIIEEAKHKPTELPVIIYNSHSEIIDYLGYRHITGVKSWGSLAKAKYLRMLYERAVSGDKYQRCRELAKDIGNKPDYVMRLLCALSTYNAMQEEGYYGIPDDNISFSLISTALSYNNFLEFLGIGSIENIELQNLNKLHLKELTLWMFEKTEGKTRLGESRNLSELSAVVASTVALKEFRDGETLANAYLLSGGPKESVVESIRAAKKHLDIAYKYAKNILLETEEQKNIDYIIETAKAIKKQTTPSLDD